MAYGNISLGKIIMVDGLRLLVLGREKIFFPYVSAKYFFVDL